MNLVTEKNKFLMSPQQPSPVVGSPAQLLTLLQLVSPTLPVGGFNYSEGLEWLVEQGSIGDRHQLQQWLSTELEQGSIRVETAVMLRAYRAVQKATVLNRQATLADLSYWNQWLTATRETQELRQQSWQMGTSLRRLLLDLDSIFTDYFEFVPSTEPVHWAIAFGIAAAVGQIPDHQCTLGYLHSWANNLISAGIRLVPLGQTAGQQILLALHHVMQQQAIEILALPDDELFSCSWGLSLASMNHETQYTRLFRS